MRYFLEISYLGSHYHGWQKQPRESSVQAELEKALSQLLKSTVNIHGSSRTDTGVHARQQFAHFDLESLSISLEDLIWKANSFLPIDIAIKQILKVNNVSHSRFDAINRKYIYRINLKKDPFNHEQSYYFKKDLDVIKMNKAADLLKNHEDFQCFSKVKTEVNNFNCSVELATWIVNGPHLEFHIKSNRFLRGMVRAIVGTLLDIGSQKISLEQFENIIISKDRRNAGSAVKAHGLCLEEVNYPKNYFNQ